MKLILTKYDSVLTGPFKMYLNSLEYLESYWCLIFEIGSGASSVTGGGNTPTLKSLAVQGTCVHCVPFCLPLGAPQEKQT